MEHSLLAVYEEGEPLCFSMPSASPAMRQTERPAAVYAEPNVSHWKAHQARRAV